MLTFGKTTKYFHVTVVKIRLLLNSTGMLPILAHHLGVQQNSSNGMGAPFDRPAL